jgi:hypothetical protein
MNAFMMVDRCVEASQASNQPAGGALILCKLQKMKGLYGDRHFTCLVIFPGIEISLISFLHRTRKPCHKI